MLRLVMITDHSDHPDKVDGGVQSVVRNLLSGFACCGDIELHVISFRHGIEQPEVVERDGYMRYLLPGTRFGAMTGYWRDQGPLNKYLAAIKPDIVHGQGIGHHGIVSIRCRYPAVLTIHGIMAEEAKFFTGFINKSRHRLMSLWSEYYCVRRAKHTILISPYVADYFSERLAGQHYMIPNPIGDAFFDVPRKPENGHILFVGRIRQLKGVMDLVESIAALSTVHDVRLLLAGSTNERDYVAELRHRIRQLGIEGRVEFCGLLSEQELRDVLARCAVMVLPSYQETAPMVIAEAMAAGVPVIATKVGGIPHQIKDGETGFLVEPGAVEQLTERLDTLLSDPHLREAVGNAATTMASQEFRAEQVAKKTIEVYRRMLS